MSGAASPATASSPRKLIALDVDGTVLTEEGELRDDVLAEVTRLREAGHEVTLATGRGVSMTLPVLDRLGITPQFVVCANGAITLKRDPAAPVGYRHHWVESFEARDVLTRVRPYLEDAHYLVENEEGEQLFLGNVPELALDGSSKQVSFEEMLETRATRVVVVSPDHTSEEFLRLVDEMGLDSVSYNVGWAAWLDIAPDGVTKASALERVRAELGIPRSQLVAIGDGRNDIDMLRWAGAEGLAVAMGQAPPEVQEVANRVTRTDLEGGLALALAAV